MNATIDDRMAILKMIEESKITAEQGAQLLAALGNNGGKMQSEKATSQPFAPLAQSPETGKGRQRLFRVLVSDTRSGRVRTSVTIPLSLVRWGLKIGAKYADEVDGIDLEQLGDILESDADGQIIDVMDEEDGEHVQIFIE